jgi:Short C-terminal domain
MIRRIEKRVGRVGLMFLGFLLATLVACVPVGVLGSSNLVWGEDNQYGRVDVPGTKVLHLPARTVDANVAIDIPGKGNETVDVPLPKDVSLAVSPVGGRGQPVITRDVGDSGNANDDRVNSQRRVWRVRVPHDGDYRVTARGDFLGIGVNPQLWLGHGPPLPGTLVPFVAAALVLFVGFVWLIIMPRLLGRPRQAATGSSATRLPRRGASAAPDTVDRLAELAELHDRGALTDDEFSAEKAKIIGAG